MKDKSQELMSLVVITGPTATGKSEVAVNVAEKLAGEIISADSMLVYRGMDIGTAKPACVEMRSVPHHLIDIIEPDQEYSVALFQKQSRALIEDIHARHKFPVLVGGTGLYIGSVIDDYDFSSARGDLQIREGLLKKSNMDGPESLHQLLSEVDPQAASKLHPMDTRRIIRALEVYYLTGYPISSRHRIDRSGQPVYNLIMFGLTMDRGKLYQRIEQRVNAMITAGLVDEVRGLLEKGYCPELTSMRGLGYKEIAAYLAGKFSFEQAIDNLKRNTRRFAKRQMTWFRRDERIIWINVDEYEGPYDIAKEIAKRIEGVFCLS